MKGELERTAQVIYTRKSYFKKQAYKNKNWTGTDPGSDLHIEVRNKDGDVIRKEVKQAKQPTQPKPQKAKHHKDETDEMFKFVEAVFEAEKAGKHNFACPICGGSAHWERATYNDHIRARCEKCKTVLMQ